MKKIVDFLSLLLAARTPEPSNAALQRDTPFDRLYQPNPTFLPGAAKKPFDVVIEPSIDSSFSGIEWAKDDEQNVKLFQAGFASSRFTTLSELIDTAVPSCGGTTLKSLAVNVTKFDSMVWANDKERKGFAHHGPCEAWIDNTRVYNARDCLASNDRWPAEIKIDYSVCKGTCSFRFYWLSTDSAPEWHAYKQCTLITTTTTRPFKPSKTRVPIPHLRTPTASLISTEAPQHNTHPVKTPRLNGFSSDINGGSILQGGLNTSAFTHLSALSQTRYPSTPVNASDNTHYGSDSPSDDEERPSVEAASTIRPISPVGEITHSHPHIDFPQANKSGALLNETPQLFPSDLSDGLDREQLHIDYNLRNARARYFNEPFRCVDRVVRQASEDQGATASTVTTEQGDRHTATDRERSITVGEKKYPKSHQSPHAVYINEKLSPRQIDNQPQLPRNLYNTYQHGLGVADDVGHQDSSRLRSDSVSGQAFFQPRPLFDQRNELIEQQQNWPQNETPTLDDADGENYYTRVGVPQGHPRYPFTSEVMLERYDREDNRV